MGVYRKGLAEDVPWRGHAKGAPKPVPKISQGPHLSVRRASNFDYAVSVMKHPDPIGRGLATEAFLESAGPECIVPGQVRPLKLLGLQLWPMKINWNFVKPMAREIQTFGKLVDRAFDLMQAPFGDR